MGCTESQSQDSASTVGFLKFMLPNIVGFVLGLAITRLFCLGGLFYLIFGIIGSIGFGVYHGVEYKNNTFKYALARQLVMVGFIVIVSIFGGIIGILINSE